ncbi:MAG TPA: hypothetical protein VG318_17370 [Actinomycetota bacterium]|nr:hypothetical protein [Actinomycetota bacterium]
MAEEREQGKTTESTERIPPGSMPPEDEKVSDAPDDADERVDKESKDSFPASDPPAW